jgi:transcriptional repressor NrdR
VQEISRLWLITMKCPYCSDENTQVVDTRENEDGDTVRRRRRCLSCDKRFTT